MMILKKMFITMITMAVMVGLVACGGDSIKDIRSSTAPKELNLSQEFYDLDKDFSLGILIENGWKTKIEGTTGTISKDNVLINITLYDDILNYTDLYQCVPKSMTFKMSEVKSYVKIKGVGMGSSEEAIDMELGGKPERLEDGALVYLKYSSDTRTVEFRLKDDILNEITLTFKEKKGK